MIEIFFTIKRPKSLDECLPSEGSEFGCLFGLGGSELELSGHISFGLFRSLKLFELDIAEPNGLTFGLKGDVTMGQE